MFDDKNLVDTILESSGAALIVQQVQEKLNEEQRRRQEFYEMIDEDSKAEFVNGEILYHSPVMKRHSDATKLLFKLLDTWVEEHELGWVGIEKSMVSLTRNDYEPDICFFGKDKSDTFSDLQLHYPAPDFVAEVLSKSSQKMIDHDRKTKYEDYEQHSVLEYWIIDPEDKTVEQYLLENGKYKLILKASQGTVSSFAVEGFVIPIPAIFSKEENKKTLRQILH
jgi:Uma2 family endonuclease